VGNIIFSPDGKHFVTLSDEEAQLYETDGFRLVGRLKHGRPIWSASFSGDSRRLATAAADGYAQVWDTDTGNPIGDALLHQRPNGLGQGDQIESVDLNQDGTRLITVTVGNEAWLWNVGSSKQIGERKAGVPSARFRPDGEQILLGGDETAELWDADLKERIARFELDQHERKGFVYKAMFSRDGSLVLTLTQETSGGTTVEIWNTDTPKRVSWVNEPSRVQWAEFSPDGTHFVTAGSDDAARVWETNTGLRIGPTIKDEKYWPFKSKPAGFGLDLDNTGAIVQVRFSEDGRRLIAASRNGFAQIWDADSFTPIEEAPSEPNAGKANITNQRIAFSADGTTGVRTRGVEIQTVDLRTGAYGKLWKYPSEVEKASLSPDGRFLATISSDRGARVQSLDTGAFMIEARHQDRLVALDLSADGTLLATVDGRLHLWDVPNHKFLRTIELPRAIKSVVFSPDGKKVAAAVADGTARVWSVETGQQIGKQMQHDFNMQSGTYYDIPVLLFSADGARLLTASGSTLRLWDATTGELIAARAHAAEVKSALFSPDGHRILSSSSDGTAKLWDATLTPIKTFRHRGAVFTAEFEKNPDTAVPERIVTLAFGDGIVVWDVATATPLANIDTSRMGLVMDKGGVAFSADGATVAASSAHGIRRWKVDRKLEPSEKLPLLAYLSSFPALTAEDRSRYLAEAGNVEVNASSARDPCDTMAADLFFEPILRGRSGAVAGVMPLDRDSEVLRACRNAQQANPKDPHFGYQVGRLLVKIGHHKEALQEFEKAAAAGDVDATVAIGKVYLDRQSGFFAPDRAIGIYQKAATDGLAPGQRELAKLYLEGKETSRDVVKAVPLLTRAARQGDGEAARLLADFLEHGEAPDFGEALIYWSLAVEIAARAGLDDRYATARRASLARFFRDRDDIQSLDRAWQEVQVALAALSRQKPK
jgi:WD40 repeat protein